MEKGGGFLKKLWYCLVGEYNRVIKYYNLGWWCKLATIKSFKVDVISFWQRASTRSNSFETLYGGQFCVLNSVDNTKFPHYTISSAREPQVSSKASLNGFFAPNKGIRLLIWLASNKWLCSLFVQGIQQGTCLHPIKVPNFRLLSHQWLLFQLTSEVQFVNNKYSWDEY